MLSKVPTRCLSVSKKVLIQVLEVLMNWLLEPFRSIAIRSSIGGAGGPSRGVQAVGVEIAVGHYCRIDGNLDDFLSRYVP